MLILVVGAAVHSANHRATKKDISGDGVPIDPESHIAIIFPSAAGLACKHQYLSIPHCSSLLLDMEAAIKIKIPELRWPFFLDQKSCGRAVRTTALSVAGRLLFLPFSHMLSMLGHLSN